ncbi:DUF1289 domain-containing protein [Pedomonas sp. V897]|uniref:DUF1289 domain-containing protein n=1 Tax=Pedomonas sp. V897 TaxID=3446482 RepID=UPI003EE1D1E1
MRVCKLDAAGLRCLGCGRTLEEISRWSAMTAQERRAVVARLAARHGPGASTEGKSI